MTFNQFIETMAEAERKFKAAVADFPEHAEFLSKSYLLVTYGSKQFSFMKKLTVAELIEKMVLLSESDFKDNLLCLAEHLKDTQVAAKKAQGQEGTRIKEKIKKIEEELNSFPIEDEEFEFVDDFDVEVIFPSVKSVIIQKLKSHPLTNKEKTCMCKACIKVYFY